MLAVAGAVLAAALVAPLAGAPDAGLPERRTPVVVAVERATPSVLNISTERVIRRRDPFLDIFGHDDPFDDMYRRFFGAQPEREYHTTSLGSGFIVDELGLVVTNAHVVMRASEISLSWADGRTARGELLATAPEHDLALVRAMGPGPFTAIPMGTSSDLLIGETAIAVGNPYGLSSSVTTGVVSALNRTIYLGGREAFRDILQTDCAINPGNSGGPLLNIRGELIGITTAIHPEGSGLGFAIPVDRIMEELPVLLDPERTRHTWLGVEVRDADRAAEVSAVVAGGPGERAGLRVGDRVVALDGVVVRGLFDFRKVLALRSPGDVLAVRVDRGGRLLDLSATLSRPPLSPEAVRVRDRLGVEPENLDPTQADPSGLTSGVRVVEVQPGSSAQRVGLQAGDVITRIGVKQVMGFRTVVRLTEVPSVHALDAYLARIRSGEVLTLYILRDGAEMSGDVTLD